MSILLKGVLGKLFKMSDAEITEFLDKFKNSEGTGINEEEALKDIYLRDAARVTALKGETKWADALKKATKDVWTAVETTLKSRFDIDSDLKGDELVDFVLETVNEKIKTPGKTLTEDEIKKHPVFISAEKAWKKLVADKEAEAKKAVEDTKKEFTQKELFAKAKEAALLKFKSLGDAILPADAEKAQRQIDKLLLGGLSEYQYQVDDKGKLIVLDKDGKRVEDEHGHAVEFDNLVENIAKSNFEFKAAQDRGAPGNGGKDDKSKSGGGEAKKYKGKAPSTKQEYLGILTSSDFDNETKLEVKKEYGEQFSKN